MLNYFAYYDASAPVNLRLPIGGLLTADANATVYADTIAAFYQTPWNVLEAVSRWRRCALRVDGVDAQAQRIGPAECRARFQRRDTANGFGT